MGEDLTLIGAMVRDSGYQTMVGIPTHYTSTICLIVHLCLYLEKIGHSGYKRVYIISLMSWNGCDEHLLSLLARRHRHDGNAACLDVRRVEHRHVLREKSWPVEHVQVEVVHLELMESVVERRVRLVVAHVPLCFSPIIV